MFATEANITQENCSSVDTLLQANEQYYHAFTQRPYFEMIGSGLLNRDEKKRSMFFNYVQIFSDYFQAMMHTRQAACYDEKFQSIFLKHLLDELGHDNLLRQRKKSIKMWDPIIVAVSTWFVHQMQVLDNIEKAVVMHLVLEKTGDFYHSLAHKVLGQHVDSDYYEVHAEHDEDHAGMITDLLPGYSAATYQRLHLLIQHSWAMMNTMVDRVHKLVMQE